MSDKSMPTGRYRRLAKVGTAAAGQAARRAGTHAATVVRTDEKATAALDKSHTEPATWQASAEGVAAYGWSMRTVRVCC